MEKPTNQEHKLEPMKEPLDISGDYERIFKGNPTDQALADWWDFLKSIKNVEFIKLKIDLSDITDETAFTGHANLMKAFREGGTSKLDTAQYPGKRQRRMAVIRCTRQQIYGSDPRGMKTHGWAANAFSSGVEWEETK